MHGLVYYIDVVPHTIELERVTAKASLVDVSARIQLTQVYHNDTPSTLSCSYMFPVPARSAVCGFAMVRQDGTRVVGVVQEKEEARVTYEDAVKEGKLASLTEQATPDTFFCSVGNVLPSETVKIELTYVTELTEGDTSDSIRFHVPAIVGQRYGDQPLFSSKPRPASSKTAFEFSANIEATSTITKVASPSHPVSLDFGPDPSLAHAATFPTANYVRVSFSASTTLEKDIVLAIHAAGLDQPRCVAELHPDGKSAAVSLTLVPRFKLPEVQGQEYIFLVDRSGSMGAWSEGEGRIGMARKALVVLLRSLPSTSTSFNVVSFGNDVESLWPRSQPYNQSTLDTATKHVDSLEANLGGTETRKALDFVFKTRNKSKATSVFVLTDGDAWDLDGVITSVNEAVASGTPSKPVRCFVLGIGNDASTAMCEAIARQGGGIAQYVVDGESFTGKTARMLKAARTPLIVHARLDFGLQQKKELEEEDFELVEAAAPAYEASQDKDNAPINLFDSSVDPLAETDSAATKAPPAPPVKLSPPARIQQAPRDLAPLYPGSRLHAYAILKSAEDLPETVFLRGELASGQKLELAVPVLRSQLATADKAGSPPPIHTIAARKVIQDLEDGKHDLAVTDDLDLTKRTVEAAIVRVGKRYSLASSQTSFVAVDESEKDKPRKATQYQVVYDSPSCRGAIPFLARGGMMRRSRMAAPMSTFVAIPPPPPAPAGAAPVFFGAAAPKAQPRLGRMMAAVKSASPFGPSSALGAAPPTGAMQTLSLAQTAPTDAAFDTSVPPPPPPPSPARIFRNQSSPQSEPDPLDLIARQQSFDGSFDPAVLKFCSPSSSLAELLVKLPAELREKEGEKKLVATAVALAFWTREMSEREEEWEGMAEKAMEYLRSETGDKAEEIVALFA
ncbi:von Willebrand domain containing protein [Rhodotorula toruloides]|uniref:von Willebrand domain containing protein n=1 Tax=Rhodotorula toruloides TaxID=5286 RepID=A0A511KDJ0_RHOTO|nr:von Willebrand domain containing protein [Rhodotorula toruloides]